MLPSPPLWLPCRRSSEKRAHIAWETAESFQTKIIENYKSNPSRGIKALTTKMCAIILRDSGNFLDSFFSNSLSIAIKIWTEERMKKRYVFWKFNIWDIPLAFARNYFTFIFKLWIALKMKWDKIYMRGSMDYNG